MIFRGFLLALLSSILSAGLPDGLGGDEWESSPHDQQIAGMGTVGAMHGAMHGAMRVLGKAATIGLPAHNLRPGGCYIIGSGNWGLSAIIYILFEGISLLQQRCPDCRFKYDHSLSTYQCPSGLSTLLDSDLLYDVEDPMIQKGSETDGCVRLNIFDVIEELRGEVKRLRSELGSTAHNSFEFGTPMGLPEALNGKRLDMIREVHKASCPTLKRLWTLNETYRSKWIEPMRRKLAGHSQPIIAIHVRGGDKLFKEVPAQYQDGLLQGDEGPYSLGARSLLAAHPEAVGGTCVIIGDDWMLGIWVAQSIKKILGCEVHHEISSESRGHWQEQFNRGSVGVRCEETMRLLNDIELLAWSNFTIGMVHSNVDEVAFRVAQCIFGREEDTYKDGMDWDMLAAYPRVMN